MQRFILTSFILLFSFYLWAQVDPSKTVLVVMDMQDTFMTRNGVYNHGANPQKAQMAIHEIIKLIHSAKKNNRPVLVVEYEGFGVTNNSIRQAIGDYKKVHVVSKTKDGVFDDKVARDKVKEIMLNTGSDTLLMTGANGGACVMASIRGAAKNKFKVHAVQSAIIDFNYRDFIYPYSYPDKRFLCGDCDLENMTTDDAIVSLTVPENEDISINDNSRELIKEVTVPSLPQQDYSGARRE